MSNFSSADINDAKRRVEEMRKKSLDYLSNDTTIKKVNRANDLHKNPISDLFDGLISASNGDSSKGLILALVLILSREGADNTLILALLYILL